MEDQSVQSLDGPLAVYDETTESTITLAPTVEGWVNIVDRFIASTVSDFTPERHEDARVILGSVVEIAYYLGHILGSTDQGIETRDRLIAAAKGR
jgi:hypothetical protein